MLPCKPFLRGALQRAPLCMGSQVRNYSAEWQGSSLPRLRRQLDAFSAIRRQLHGWPKVFTLSKSSLPAQAAGSHLSMVWAQLHAARGSDESCATMVIAPFLLCIASHVSLIVCSMTSAVRQPSQTSQVRAATAPAGVPPNIGAQGGPPSGGNHSPQGQGDNFFTLGELFTV